MPTTNSGRRSNVPMYFGSICVCQQIGLINLLIVDNLVPVVVHIKTSGFSVTVEGSRLGMVI